MGYVHSDSCSVCLTRNEGKDYGVPALFAFVFTIISGRRGLWAEQAEKKGTMYTQTGY